MPATTTHSANRSVYLLNLTDQGAPDIPGGHNYIYLPPPTEPAYLLRISIEGTSSICRKGSLWVNLPEEGRAFDRHKYREIKLSPDFNRSIEIDIPIFSAGAFAFYTTYTPLPDFSTKAVPQPEPTKTPTYYIDVAPNLLLNGSPLPLDSLSIFSVISKFMGDYPADWDKHLKGVGEREYNMVHFTPLMQRGDSNSPYSIYDQLAFDKEHFPNGEKDIADLISKMEKEYGLLSLTDVVFNHTANNSTWLEDHPDAGYNIKTAPWLESACALDTALLKLSSELPSLGLPTKLSGLDDLSKIMDSIKTRVISGARLWEYYVIDVERDSKNTIEAWKSGKASVSDIGDFDRWPLKAKADWVISNGLLGMDRLGERFRRQAKLEIVAGLLESMFGHFDDSNEVHATNVMHSILDECNLQFYREYDADIAVMTEQLFNRIKYMRLDDHGPKLGPIDAQNPLIETYFTRLPANEKTKKHSADSLSLVNNGWIWAADAMNDNAGPASRAYLRREVIVWTDCVKLRYGDGPEDSPFLWDFMAKYTRLMAKYFTGFRIDNCHSTPLHVAEYMLDQARTVRPNLAVFAELFTGNEATDFVFVQRLGLSSLIREAMQAGSTAELSRLVHLHGGIPIGSFEVDEVANAELATAQTNGHVATSETIHTIRPSPVHALFFDCTHDNEVPAQKRDARDTLPNAALVAMCSCATGSVMGYDEIYPKLIEMVREDRHYDSVSSTGSSLEVKAGAGGIGSIKKLINRIHVSMGKAGYDETYIDHKDQYITVHRVQPQSRKGYFLVAHTAFPGYGSGRGNFSPVHLVGTKAKQLGSWKLEVDNSSAARDDVENDKRTLRGLPSQTIDIKGVTIDETGDDTTIFIPDDFPPGSIALFETWVPAAEHAEGLDTFVTTGAAEAVANLDLADLNFVLYRCDAEERDTSSNHDGVYTIPNFGPLVYAGLQGWWSVLRDIVRNNDLGHPLCNHLREGQWALDYCAGRLERLSKDEGNDHFKVPAAWLRSRFDAICKLPSFLMPRYFALVIQTAYDAARNRAIKLMSPNIKNGQPFLKSLALVSVQMNGYMKSTSLYPQKRVACLAAGLPHFASDWARCWGRDVFISLRGLLLGTGRYDDAREHIHGFASVLKHGMIPNLLSAGKLPRYNSRDSIWFFLQSIQDFTKMAPNGISILQDSIKRRFLPYDDTWFEFDDPRAYSKSSSIEDIIQEALQRHASGMSFREANAGSSIDSQMSDNGFNLEIHVGWDTGIIFGGNQNNCGTWMDKMGESPRAGSQGVPGTPRDGAAVEITGMLYSTLVWVAQLHKKGQYKYSGVSTSHGSNITFEAWAQKIKDNFERCYYVPIDPNEDSKYVVNPKAVNRRGIYKDLFKSGKEYEDYQLRPNFPVAMCVAPELFDPERALYALSVADSALRKDTGMATLDPTDLNYRPNYINSEDSTDFQTSKGRNYHQGPEWLWPTGFFLRALLKFDLMRKNTAEERVESYQQITRRLAGCQKMIKETPWAGLTELTNLNGSFCSDSCPTQAWSAGCLIDLFHDALESPVE